jgi:hypothetical protein
MRTQPESDAGLQPSVAPAAVCPGTFLDASPDTVLGFGGAVYSRKLKLASERLEFLRVGRASEGRLDSAILEHDAGRPVRGCP